MRKWAVIKWHADDIKNTGLGYKLTNKEISDVLCLIEKKHDCNNGVTWETIEYYIDQILDERGQK